MHTRSTIHHTELAQNLNLTANVSCWLYKKMFALTGAYRNLACPYETLYSTLSIPLQWPVFILLVSHRYVPGTVSY